jgi:hypothetical protein
MWFRFSMSDMAMFQQPVIPTYILLEASNFDWHKQTGKLMSKTQRMGGPTST